MGGHGKIMRNNRGQHLYFALGLSAMALTPRCSCDTSPEIGRAAVQMRLTLVEIDPCSGSAIPRNIPDDYERGGLPLISSLGSTAERVFEVRSVGTAPLSVDVVSLSEQDEEFLVETLNSDGEPLELPIQIPANLTADAVAPMVIKVSYASADDAADAVKLKIETDDPDRSLIEFNLVAGKGRLEICGSNGCDMPAVNFGSVSQIAKRLDSDFQQVATDLLRILVQNVPAVKAE